MSRALPKNGGTLCDVQGYERPAFRPGHASYTTKTRRSCMSVICLS
jgi:hypothetical protein